jgi:hypothetical protein
MYRIGGGVLALLLALPAVWAQDKPKDADKGQPAGQAAQYQALLKQYEEALKTWQGTYEKAAAQEEKDRIYRQYPAGTFGPKFLAVAEKDPKTPTALDALTWVMTNSAITEDAKAARSKAIDLLRQHHLASEKLGRVCQALAYSMEKRSEQFLRAVREKNDHKQVLAEACLCLAQNLRQQASTIKRLQADPKAAKSYEGYLGKDRFEELKKANPTEVQAEGDKLLKEFTDKHVAAVKPERLAILCRNLGYSDDKGSEDLLRTLLEKDARREVQGVACLSLAQVLKRRANAMPPAEAKAAGTLRTECEKLLERAADKYADVKMAYRGTVGAKAKSELFDLRHLGVGNSAPDVEGVDQDGKKFKLGDYKGKVVLLDFWSRY